MRDQWETLFVTGGWIYLLPFAACLIGVGVHALGHRDAASRADRSLIESRIVYGDEVATGMTVLLRCRGGACLYAGVHGRAAVHPLSVTRMRATGRAGHLVLTDLSGAEHGMGPVLANATVRVLGSPPQTVWLDLSTNLSASTADSRADCLPVVEQTGEQTVRTDLSDDGQVPLSARGGFDH